ncbi:hypothetical protein HDU67_004141 [Dinochytrium kinnereticum]|nr:hypothetical protein HDU67_004141 [Dinochytrium kinnereticum]
MDDSETDVMGQAFWDVVDEDLPACNLLIAIGASIEPNTAMEVLVDSIPPHIPRLLIDTLPSGPFSTKLSRPTPPASDTLEASPDRDVIESGGNYRDVAILFPESEGGISRGVKELVRACKWGWDWDVGADVGVKLKVE